MRIANAPCSWGVIENIDGNRITYEQLLDEIAATQYTGTELGDWGFMPTDPAKLRDELEKRSLELIGSWVTVYLHDPAAFQKDREQVVKTAKLMKAAQGDGPLVVLGNDPFKDPVRNGNAGRIQPQHMLSVEDSKQFAKRAEDLARIVRDETGLRTVLHHHVGTWIETPEETSRFLDQTDADLVGLTFDTGHWTFGGGDALQGLQQHWDRIWHIHFKGFSPKVAQEVAKNQWTAVQAYEHGVFSELAHADIDFATLLAFIQEKQYKGWIVVEQDVLPGMGTPKENAQRNRVFLRGLGV